LSFLNENQTIVQREKVIALFGNVADFTRMHANRKEDEGIEDWLGI
jgi:hypothetical protein